MTFFLGLSCILYLLLASELTYAFFFALFSKICNICYERNMEKASLQNKKTHYRVKAY